MSSEILLRVQELNISFTTKEVANKVVDSISFNISDNEILAIVGESGSGKSITSLAIMKLLPNQAKYSGQVLYNQQNLLSLDKASLRSLRGNQISMIFQEPMSSLNPSLTCGYQVLEILQQHTSLSTKEAKKEVLSLFERVRLPRPEALYNSYPHQLSGGQKQRVMIAMAIACKPQILIADEPTTALDVTVQKEILLLLKTLQQETKMSIIFISHDLSLVSDFADRVAVMYQGNIVEIASAKALFRNPQHTYTKALLRARPSMGNRLLRLPTIKDFIEGNPALTIEAPSARKTRHKDLYKKTPLLEVNNVSKTYLTNTSLFSKKQAVHAVDQVSFKLYEGETLGLVGESGCGKSTLGNAILHLDPASDGTILFQGNNIATLGKDDLRAFRKDVQLIFQDPFASLNPRLTVGAAIIEPMLVHKLYNSKKERKEKALELLARVGLSESHFYRYPHEFSGGQRQRIGIARTIAVNPKLIVCDESVSALDISVQAQVLNLLNELKDLYSFTYIFISHDLAVVKYMADQLLVMNKGKIEEMGEADAIYASPKKSYTKRLIDAIPKGL